MSVRDKQRTHKDYVLVFINNTPRAYAWGSTDALPAILREAPTGEPQAELWLGDHEGGPALVAKASAEPQTLRDLIAGDPAAYGVDGGSLPFLLKILAIGAPLSIQVHPDSAQARAGFAREEAAGIPRSAAERSYRDPNHKPELLVALAPTRALCGFRPLSEARSDLTALTVAAGTCGAPGSQALRALGARLAERDGTAEEVRDRLIAWAFSGTPDVRQALVALRAVLARSIVPGLDSVRQQVLGTIIDQYPEDPGAIVSLLLGIVELAPGEALFLGARQIHAYVSGVGIEVMASSDNVLRAGLTTKHVDADELRRVISLAECAHRAFPGTSGAPGLTTWQPDVPDFVLHRVRLQPQDEYEGRAQGGSVQTVRLETPYPAVMIVTSGIVRVEARSEGSLLVANAYQGQSLYISAGQVIEFSGHGEAFVASVGETWAQHRSGV